MHYVIWTCEYNVSNYMNDMVTFEIVNLNYFGGKNRL
jgi:hypothetical protein